MCVCLPAAAASVQWGRAQQRAVPRPLHQSESRQSTSVNVSSRSSPPKMAATEARSSQVIHFTSAKCSFTPLLLLGTVLPVRCHLYDFYRATPRYFLSSCVRPSVRVSITSRCVSERLDESSWYLAWTLTSSYPMLCY